VTVGQNAATVNFQLQSRPLDLDAVVVTGSAGPTAVREVGHAIAQLSTKDIKEPVVTFDQMLMAKIPGVVVIPSTGLSGSGAKIRLRGSSSVALSNQPLVYVDGVRIRSDGYPKNVPAFGERNRSNNDTPSPLNDINLADVERVEVVRGPAATTLYGTEAATGVIQIFTKRGVSGRTVWNTQVDGGVSSVRPYGPDDEPYIRLEPWLRNAVSAGYALSASGGSDVRYHVSSSYRDSEGVLPNDSEKRLTLRGNFDFVPVPKLAFSWSSALTINNITNTAQGPNNQGLTQNVYRGSSSAIGSEGKESLDRILAWDLSTGINHAISGLTMVLSPGGASSHTLTFGYDRAESDMRSLRPFGYVFTPQGILAQERWLSTTTTADYLGRTRFGMRGNSAITLAWGAQSIATRVTSLAGFAEGFAGPGEPTLSSGAVTFSAESRVKAVIAGAFAQATFDHRDKLFLTAGMRVDGSSSFGTDFGLQPFPRLSASYIVSDENFWPGSLGIMKLRAAYGQAGRAPRVFDADRTWAAVGFDGKPAYLPASMGNSKLGPERSAETEIGFDASRSDDRLRAQFTWYRRDTHEALLPVAQPPSLGFLTPQLENVGLLRTSGLELALGVTTRAPLNSSLDLGIDFALNRTKAVDLGGNPDFVLSESAWIRQGEPTPVLIGPLIRNPSEIADPDMVQGHVFGPNMPTRVIGVHSALRLIGGTELGVRVEYQGGNYLFDNASGTLFANGVHPLCNAAYAAKAAGTPELLNAWERIYCNPASAPSNGPVVRGDFARLRDLSVTMPVPGRLMRARNASITFAARNLTLWKNSDLGVFDPEMGGREGMFAPVRTIELSVPTAAAFSIAVRATYW
jgi:outer membrane cobalamin receptor